MMHWSKILDPTTVAYLVWFPFVMLAILAWVAWGIRRIPMDVEPVESFWSAARAAEFTEDALYTARMRDKYASLHRFDRRSWHDLIDSGHRFNAGGPVRDADR